MSDIFSQIGSFLSSGAGKTALTGATAGGGFLQNWLANREAQKKQQFVENLITDPKKWSAFVASKEQPLQAGLTQDIARSTDAYGAERGLGSSPAVMKDVYAQALAPYIQNQQQMAQNAALESLGIYEGSPTTKPVDITSILKAFIGLPGSRPGPFGSTPPAVLGGAPGGQIPVETSPTPDQQIPSSGGSPFDYSSLLDSGILTA